MQLDPQHAHPRDLYRLMTSLIVPRPIAWTGTRSAASVNNLAPFSYFMGVTNRPPALAISVARLAGGALKDTARNILETGVFTVSIVSRPQAEAMNATAATLPPEVSEFDAAGLEVLDGDRVAAPRPAVARASMECKLWRALDLDSVHLIVGEILLFHVDDALLNADGGVSARGLDPISRLGGLDYADLGDIFSIMRPSAG